MFNKRIKYEMDRVLSDKNKCIHETHGVGGVLAGLWRTILLDHCVTGLQFENLLNDFIASAQRKIPDNRVAKLFTRGNLRRELERTSITFKVFMKGIKLLRVVRMKITVELEFSRGDKTIHHTFVDMNSGDYSTDLYELREGTNEETKETNK